MVIEEPKKKSNAPLIILMFLIGIGIGFGANYGMSYFNIGVDKKESSTTEDATKIDKLELTESAKAKMEMFIKSATICSSGSADCGISKKFIEDVNKLDNSAKYTIAWNYIKFIGNFEGDMTNDPLDYSKLDTYLSKETFDSIDPSGKVVLPFFKKSFYDNVYAQFFNEKPNYNVKDLESIGCPSPVAIDAENDKLYYYSACGGIGYATEGIVKSYDIDGDNYIVHSEITEYSVGEEDVVHKVLWKFDKDLNFISTEKE